jgi:hypothetical protein
LPRVAASVLPQPHPERFNPQARTKRNKAQAEDRFGQNILVLDIEIRTGLLKARILAVEKNENKQNLP